MLSRKRRFLAQVLAQTRIAPLCLRLTGSCERLTVLAYHRIVDLGDEDRFAFDPELVSASQADFAWQMEFVRRHFNAITFATLLESLEQGRPLPPRALVISFDDGHRDNYESAFPVLRRLGVPATIFLSTGYIGTQDVFWFERVAHLLYCRPAGVLAIREIGFEADLLDVPSRRAATALLLEILKAVPNDKRLETLARLEQLAAAPAAVDGYGDSGLSWEQVREMSDWGIEFGSHAVTHPVLTRLDDEALDRELVESRRTIEARTGKTCQVLAYPVGAFEPRVVSATQRAGYKLGVGYSAGANDMRRFESFAIRRLHVERYMSRAYFQSMVALPQVFER